MGRSAIRQGDVLYFARSLVWRITAMVSDEIKNLPEAIRFERCLDAWERYLRLGGECTQEEADRIAAMFGTRLKIARSSYGPGDGLIETY